MAASPEEIALEEQPPATGGETTAPVSNTSPKKGGETTSTPTKKSKNANLINCVVFLPDGTTVSLDVDVSKC